MTALKMYNSTTSTWESVVGAGIGMDQSTADTRYVNTAGDTATGDIIVPDEAYATGWNGSLEVPTKNAVYDAIGDIGGAPVMNWINLLNGRTISTTAPLSGGGDLTANRTLSILNDGVTNTLLAQMATMTIKGNNTAGTTGPLDLTMTQVRAMLADTLYNASVTNQAGFASDTYLAGASIVIPSGRLQAKSMYHCVFNVVKTAAGVATPIINIRFGTGGVVGDTSRGTLTFSAQSGVIDEGVFEIWAVFRTVGSGTTATLQTLGQLSHRLGYGTAGTGLSVVGSESEVAISGGFDSTVANSVIGLSVNGGSSASWTVSLVQAELFNLA